MVRNSARNRPGGPATPLRLISVLTGALLTATLTGPLPAAADGHRFVVTSAGDEADQKADGDCRTARDECTLRAALVEAARAPGRATVAFAIPGPGPHVITPATKLPALTNPAGVTLDGYTQAGSSPNSAATASNAVLQVELRGTGSAGFDGLSVQSPGNVVSGLAIYNFAKSIALVGSPANNNTITGNHICTDAAGAHRAPSVHTAAFGVVMTRGAHSNRVGAPGPENRNVVSGCGHRGIIMSFSGTTANVVQNNVVGLNPAGTAALGNRSHGIDINYTGGNLVGGPGPQEGNLISGNAGAGVEVSHSRRTNRNEVIGNLIGTDPTGETAPTWASNGQWGVRLEGPKFCDPCTEAGVSEGLPYANVIRGNVVVGNAKGGLLLDKGVRDNVVEGNAIGVTSSGAPGPNGVYGLRIERGAYGNTIGPDNHIAYNAKGVTITSAGYAPPGPAQDTYGNRITRNRIHDNTGYGIDLAPFGKPNRNGTGDALVQRVIQMPTIGAATAGSVSGTATYASGAPCASCTVELFIADSAATWGEGADYVASTSTSADGSFVVDLPGSPLAGQTVTVNATDAAGNTSEFAQTRTIS